jgi:hypothetical protein
VTAASADDQDLEALIPFPILPPKNGFLFLDRVKFHASFAGDLPDEQAAFMAGRAPR